MFAMNPKLDERTARDRLALRNFIFVVRKQKIDATEPSDRRFVPRGDCVAIAQVGRVREHRRPVLLLNPAGGRRDRFRRA